MEKFFIVTEESSLYKDWFEYKENRSRVREMVKEFTQTHEIESDGYFVTTDDIYIVPTAKDKETFGSVLCSPISDGLQKFKGNSKVGKAWAKIIKEAGIKVEQKPRLIFYIRSQGGRYRSRLFDYNEAVYCSIDPAPADNPHGFIEIKASDFFKIIEESEAAIA
ncbi:hypothetical protein D3C72_247220 [compost metagenome]